MEFRTGLEKGLIKLEYGSVKKVEVAASTFLHNSSVLKVSLHACDSITALLRHLALVTIRELSVFPKRRSRHFYFSTVDGSILLPSGESELWRRLVEVFTSTLYLLCVSVSFYFQY